MSAKTDYLGREMVCDSVVVDELLETLGDEFRDRRTVDVVAALETVLADIVFNAAKSRADAHVGIDRIADDMKKYLNALYAQRDRRKDQAGHA